MQELYTLYDIIRTGNTNKVDKYLSTIKKIKLSQANIFINSMQIIRDFKVKIDIIELFNVFKKHKYNILKTTNNEPLPLAYAVRYNKPDFVKACLLQGAKVNIPHMEEGGNILHNLAVYAHDGLNETKAITNLLLQYKAKKDTKNKHGHTAYDIAKNSYKYSLQMQLVM